MRTYLVFAALLIGVYVFPQGEQCTIGVASGSATKDGRPLVWKTRDYISELDNELRYNVNHTYKFIYVAGAGGSTSARMGVNQHGLAIVNSTSSDLPDGSASGINNGQLIRNGLGNCKTVEEFEDYLDETDVTGRSTNGNFAVIDSTGAAAIFEVGRYIYWRFDAEDEPNGYVLRTNFAVNGGGSTGIQRLARSVNLVSGFHAGDSLNHQSILRYQMRDFSDGNSQPIRIPFPGSYGGRPYGYIETDISICRNSSVSASVITGVLPDENPMLSTMWTILGQPASSVALPYWPIGYPPFEADGVVTAQLCDISLQIRELLYDYQGDNSYIDTYKLLDGEGGGLWTKTFPYEDEVFAQTETLLNTWRAADNLPLIDMKNTQDSLAANTYQFLQSCLNYMLSSEGHSMALQQKVEVYPNPFSSEATLIIEALQSSDLQIKVYSLNGQLLTSRSNIKMNAGENRISIPDIQLLPEGILVMQLVTKEQIQMLKIFKKH